MYINDELIGDALVLKLKGRVMGGPDVDLFHGKLYRYVNSGGKKLVLDLTQVERFSSVGLGIMLSAQTTMNRNNGQLRVANIPETIDSLLTITKLVTVFDAKDSVAEAIASFENSYKL
jgi:anti-sigma B factor antagonist